MNARYCKKAPDWGAWKTLFASRRDRPLPDPFAPEPGLDAVPASVARSLAVFQLGESGGGTVVAQARRSRLAGIDADYTDAMSLFVAEEHRHAELLACAVRMLGGRLARQNWTANLFVFGRRLMGLRLKIAVLLAAEVVGMCYYRLVAAKLPDGTLRSMLEDIVEDEIDHLDFHCAFLRTQTGSRSRLLAFRTGWRVLSQVAALVALIEHRRALTDLGIGYRRASSLWMAMSRKVERRVTGQEDAHRARRLRNPRPCRCAGIQHG